MNLTVLFDLDDTLLSNEMGKFQGFYFQFLGNALNNYAPAKEVITQVVAASKKMIAKQTIAGTMEDIFDQSFYPAIGISKEVLQEPISAFYRNVFPELKKLTRSIPEAVEIVRRLMNENTDVVIATQPLFPYTAIQQRLEWAKLPVDTFQFNLVTTYEIMHFSKPNPAYLAEILAQLGNPDQPAVMVGNSLEDDLMPAVQLGLPAFLLLQDGKTQDTSLPSLVKAGGWEDLFPWLEAIARRGGGFQPAHTPEALLARLKAAPAAMDTLTHKLSENDLHKRPSEGEWCSTEVLAHLRDVDTNVNLKRVEQILDEDMPFIPGIETDRWAEERNYYAENGQAALKGFMDGRMRLVEALEHLRPLDWNRPARHAIFGPTTLAELMEFITTHDTNHIRQVQQTIRP